MNGDRAPDALLWLGFAIGDLKAARSQPGRHVRPRIVAFHSQQAAEKAVKAALVLAGVDPPRTHDLYGSYARTSSATESRSRN